MIASLDTNVIVRLFVDENSAQTAAAHASLTKYEQLYIADVTIIESVYILAEWYKLGRTKTKELIDGLMNHPKINCNKVLFSKVMPFYTEHPALSIEDCCIVFCADLSYATPLLTFDKKLANQSPHAKLLKV